MARHAVPGIALRLNPTARICRRAVDEGGRACGSCRCLEEWREGALFVERLPCLEAVVKLSEEAVEHALTHLAQRCTRTGSGRAGRRQWWPDRRQRSPAQATCEEAAGALRALHRLSLIDHTCSAG